MYRIELGDGPVDPATTGLAACEGADTDLFFPDSSDISGARQVIKDYCAKCPVMDLCLEWAMSIEGGVSHSNRHGIYGGKTARGRGNLRWPRQAA